MRAPLRPLGSTYVFYPITGALRARQRKADAALAQEAMQSMADATLGLGHRDISPDASSHAGTDAAFRPYGSRVHELEAAAAESLLGPELRVWHLDECLPRLTLTASLICRPS